MVRNLDDPKVAENQAFLEVSAGYWLRLSMASDPDCIGKLLAQFASISRDLLASSTHQTSAPIHPSRQALSSVPHSDVRSGLEVEGSLGDYNGYPDAPQQEGDNLTRSGQAGRESNLTLTDPWLGIWDLGEDMAWIDIVGTPGLRTGGADTAG